MIEKLVRKFLYYPTTLDKNDPPPPDLGACCEVWLKSASGYSIHGLYWKGPEDRPVILFLHGNAQSVFDWGLVWEEVAAMECGMLLIDYPGYGKSEGTPHEEGLYQAGRAAMAYLRDEMGFEPARDIILFGKSLGGGVACQLATEMQVAGLVLESTFRSIPSVAHSLIPMLPHDAIFKTERYASIEKIGSIHAPVLVIHGDHDEVVPYDDGVALFEAANEPKTMIRVLNAGHNDVSLVEGESYGRKLREWLDTI